VIVALESSGNTDELKAFGRLVAMQVASAIRRRSIHPAGPAAIEREKGVAARPGQAATSPKDRRIGPETFYKEVPCSIKLSPR